jgi:hypothetical protein
MARLHEQARQLARLVGGDSSGDAEEDSGHARIVPYFLDVEEYS